MEKENNFSDAADKNVVNSKNMEVIDSMLKKENHLSADFLKFYNGTLRPVAVKCADAFQDMVAIERGEKFDENKPMHKKIKEAIDPNAIWYIGLMIGDIDKASIQGIRLNLINSIGQVNGCLNSESYWKNVWKGDFSSEEAKNLKELAGLTEQLIKKL